MWGGSLNMRKRLGRINPIDFQRRYMPRSFHFLNQISSLGGYDTYLAFCLEQQNTQATYEVHRGKTPC